MKKIKMTLALLALIVSVTACGGSETTVGQVTRNPEVAQTEASISAGAAQNAKQNNAQNTENKTETASALAENSNSASAEQAPQTTQVDQTTQTAEAGMIYSLEDEIADAKKVKLNLPANTEVLTDFAASMERMRDEGLELLSCGMTRQASYCFSFAGGSVSALRLAAEKLLGQESTGFADWDTVGAISFATPVPLLCEAVVADHKGNAERAEECKALAEMNPNQIADYETFAAIAKLDKNTLEELAASLFEFEKHIYWFYPADPIPRDRNGLEWSPEFHLVLAAAFEEVGQTKLATDAYLDALAQDPFNPELFAMCAKSMYQAGDVNLMRTYILEGLLMDPDHDLLNALGALFFYAMGDTDLAKEYLAAAQAANSTDEEVLHICDSVAAAMEGGE